MKKAITTQLLCLSAMALTCSALLSGSPFLVGLEEHSSNNPPAFSIQDESRDAGSNDEENKENTMSEDPGIQPLNDWEKGTIHR